jgi:peptidyl-prolyl cis-trans isomerase A (cyclophilin A)
MMKRISSVCLLTLAFLACKSQEGNAEPKAPNTAALKDPSKLNEKAPDKFTVKLETTAGDILMDVDRSWAPKGADRFYNLVKNGYYDDVAFFRVIGGFMAQVGIHGDPELNKVWRNARIEDDKVKQSNTPGMVSFATAGPNTRTTQFFINFGNNARLDGMGFAPFAKVRDMKVVEKLYAGYGEGAPSGKGPSQGRLQTEGNKYLKAEFPKLSWIKKATIVK